MRLTLRLLCSTVQKRPFYVSTPIFYVNAAPHLGHLYSAVVADAIQRFEKLTHPDCNIIFSTGTDEHGTKVQQAAAAAQQPLAEYCARVSRQYRDLFREHRVQYTDFVRTTEERHKTAVHHFWNKLVEGEHIYKAQYAGWYSVNDESFVPEAQVRDELRNGQKVKVSAESGHPVEWTEEPNYMFRLSAFRTPLQRWLSTEGVITPHKFQKQLQEQLAREAYLPDISVSRPAARVHWAVRVPGDESQSVYVWLDALVSYLTACGFPDPDAMRARRAWPADVHVVGKDILKFHGLYWPAFLMAVRWAPPRRLVCHAHWTVDGCKMSKSLGNVVSPASLRVSGDALRYFLLREGTLHSDANYSESKMINIVNSELADTLGNLASRCCGAALNPRAEFPALHEREAAALAQRGVTAALLTRVERLPDTCRQHYSQYQFYLAVDAVLRALRLANLFFETHKPWELAKQTTRQKELDVILHVTLETLRICGIVLQPVIPELASQLLGRLHVPAGSRSWAHCEVPSWRVSGAIHETKHIQGGKLVLFQRVYLDKHTKKKAAQ